MSALLALWRLSHALAVAIGGFFTIVVRFPQLPQSHRDARVQAWAGRMLQVLGVRLVVRGTPPVAGPMLLVANHISWLDILVMHASRHCRFVAKGEIRRWPLIGTLATGGGTLYIERSTRREAMRVLHDMQDSLTAGEVVAVFPEGTTGDGNVLLPFHGNLIQAAIAANAPAQPVALRFIDARTGQTSHAARYLDESLLGSLWRTARARDFTALVVFGQPQLHGDRNRRQWAKALQREVDALRKQPM